MITVEPPVVQPSLGEIALMQGTAEAGYRPEIQNEYVLFSKKVEILIPFISQVVFLREKIECCC